MMAHHYRIGDIMPDWLMTLIFILLAAIMIVFLIGVCIAAGVMISSMIEDYRSSKASRKFWEERNK